MILKHRLSFTEKTPQKQKKNNWDFNELKAQKYSSEM